jgi:hypothetical protein
MAGPIETDFAFVEQPQVKLHALAIVTHENQGVAAQQPAAAIGAKG